MDPYAPCPCGSGKKVKFCCQKLLPEMEKIERLQENQPEQALAHLDRLERSNAGNPWIVTTRAGTLMQQGEYAAAKIALLKFLKEHPDHPRANALYAFAAFHADGYPACKKAVHRAFKRCVEESPRIVSALAASLGYHHLQHDNFLAARAHYVVALRTAGAEERERLIENIIEFDGEHSIPFVFRGGQRLPAFRPSRPADQERFDRARHLGQLACWEEAADVIEELSEQQPDSAELRHWLGLYRAWDGDEESAAEALHAAAERYSDLADSVECETLAQLLDRSHSDQVLPVRLQRYTVSSVSRLLSLLDDDPRFARSDEQADTPQQGAPSGLYLVLDRPRPAKSELANLTEDQVPLYVGRVLVFDGAPEDGQPPSMFLTGLEGDQLAAAESALLSIAGDVVQRELPPSSSDESTEPLETDAELDILGEINVDELPLHRNYFIPPGTPADQRLALQESHWRRVESELWPTTPQAALGGLSPSQAAGDPKRRVALHAALHVFQTFADVRQRLLDVGALRQRLQLEPLPPPAADRAEGGLTNFDLERADFAALDRDDLEELIQRLRLSSHLRLLYAALQEWMGRAASPPEGEGSERLTPAAACKLLASVAVELSRPEEALKWIEQGREIPSAMEERFANQLSWKVLELRVRSQFFPAAEVRDLLLDLWRNYGAKLPSLREQLTQIVERFEIVPPWETAIVTADSNWSPTTPVAADAPKSLWLPGQD
jgi:tetratricopeptide (TPR) repeat protein